MVVATTKGQRGWLERHSDVAKEGLGAAELAWAIEEGSGGSLNKGEMSRSRGTPSPHRVGDGGRRLGSLG
jgi:hypothetical protein